MAQNRVFWAVEAIGLKGNGDTGNYTEVHGAQSVGITTTFNLEQVFELGQIQIYENIENLPDIEVTTEKVLDGYPLIYHLATVGAPTATLAGRQNQRSIFAMSIFNDTQDSASGVPLATVEMSGMYVSSLTYTFPTDGNCTEQVTLVGNNKLWANGGDSSYGIAFSGLPFDNNDQPLALSVSASGGIQRRENVIFNGQDEVTLLPVQLPGISTSGTNDKDGDIFGCHVTNLSVSTSLGRESINELGRRGPYFRYATFPVDVTTEISFISLSGDLISATEKGTLGDGNNLVNSRIKIVTQDGLVLDMGDRNKISNISETGGDTGGGNRTITYTYVNQNILTVTHPQDPSF